MRPYAQYIEEVLNQISMKKKRDRANQLFISKTLLDHVYGRMKIFKKTSRQLNIKYVFEIRHLKQRILGLALTRGQFTWYVRFRRGFYGLDDEHKIIQETSAGTFS